MTKDVSQPGLPHEHKRTLGAKDNEEHQDNQTHHDLVEKARLNFRLLTQLYAKIRLLRGSLKSGPVLLNAESMKKFSIDLSHNKFPQWQDLSTHSDLYDAFVEVRNDLLVQAIHHGSEIGAAQSLLKGQAHLSLNHPAYAFNPASIWYGENHKEEYQHKDFYGPLKALGSHIADQASYKHQYLLRQHEIGYEDFAFPDIADEFSNALEAKLRHLTSGAFAPREAVDIRPNVSPHSGREYLRAVEAGNRVRAAQLQLPTMFSLAEVSQRMNKEVNEIWAEIWKGEVLALSNELGELKIPLWQFESGLRDPVRRVLKAIRGADPWSAYFFFVNSHPYFGKAPLAALADGAIDAVLLLAAEHVEDLAANR
ncbi:hypothetical protein ABIC63_000756 [Pseudacidovorax sp. 1753]|uniref:hypothetical protein n=1 Tax=Pseudacidovorax sp. 1753 TaxID=3156419 RepID=UPI003399E6E9